MGVPLPCFRCKVLNLEVLRSASEVLELTLCSVPKIAVSYLQPQGRFAAATLPSRISAVPGQRDYT